jgi:hypothetical protein
MILAALSCFQGRPAGQAAAELLALGFDGIQLTPGCAPDPTITEITASVPTRTHHGYTPSALRTRVWSDTGELLTAADSVHPPRTREIYRHALEHGFWGTTIEVMYHPLPLGSDDDIEDVLAAGLPVALDVSHLHISRTAGALSGRVLAKLLAYDNLTEIHVSANDGTRDAHHPLSSDTYGLAWARERCNQHTPVVFEGYLHRLDHAARTAQLEILHGALG